METTDFIAYGSLLVLALMFGPFDTDNEIVALTFAACIAGLVWLLTTNNKHEESK